MAFSSLLCAAVTIASLAPSADENVFWPGCCAMERMGTHSVKNIVATANLARVDLAGVNLVRLAQ